MVDAELPEIDEVQPIAFRKAPRVRGFGRLVVGVRLDAGHVQLGRRVAVGDRRLRFSVHDCVWPLRHAPDHDIADVNWKSGM